ncbi:MAG TPA: thioesterase family protein [Thermoanaerobaculia bacterium]
MTKTVESRLRVRYKETDQMAIAHHSNHIVWFEIGRTDLCRETGIPYAEIEARGYILVVVEVHCRYREAFRYDDEVVIRTRVAELGSRSITFAYELFDPTGTTMRADGYTKHFWLDRETRRPVRVDEEVLAAFQRWAPGEQ